MQDVSVLRAEIRTLWALDANGKLVQRSGGQPAPYVLLATAPAGRFACFGAALPHEHEAAISTLVRRWSEESASGDPSNVPAVLGDIASALIEAGIAFTEHSGPSYLVVPGTEVPCDSRIVASDSAESQRRTLAAPPGANWRDWEWRELLSGDVGPWAMAVDEHGRVLSITHSARLSGEGAEAGAWTSPEARGRGLAAAVTARWAKLVRATGRHAFYSTSAGNVSSQRVAARLNAELLGWLWTFRPQ